ncbi:MAG TPA: GntR family transcriptional regulator [Capillimicrobium sp.]|nr:GntR family transcriptional regulator [Capillimicrobium sp.]
MASASDNPPRLASDAVHDRLRRAILRGDLPPGSALPSERELSAKHRVNRHAVREAIKRLQQSGLVQVSQGGATRVLDWRLTGGLDLLDDLAQIEDGGELRRAIAEMRATIGIDAARLCAERAGEALRDELRRLGAALRDPAEHRRYQDRFEAYEALWARIVDGSENLAYRLAFNSLVGVRHARDVDLRVYAAEVDDPVAGRHLANAVADGDVDRARRTAHDLLRRTLEAAVS